MLEILTLVDLFRLHIIVLNFLLRELNYQERNEFDRYMLIDLLAKSVHFYLQRNCILYSLYYITLYLLYVMYQNIWLRSNFEKLFYFMWQRFLSRFWFETHGNYVDFNLKRKSCWSKGNRYTVDSLYLELARDQKTCSR